MAKKPETRLQKEIKLRGYYAKSIGKAETCLKEAFGLVEKPHEARESLRTARGHCTLAMKYLYQLMKLNPPNMFK